MSASDSEPISPLTQHPEAVAYVAALQEEHLEEIGFLLDQRLAWLSDPEIAWRDTLDIEQRIRAQIRALRSAGQPAVECARAGLGGEDEDLVRGSVHALVTLSTEAGDLELLSHGLENASDDLAEAWLEALRHPENPFLDELLQGLLESEQEIVRARVAALLGYRRAGNAKRLAKHLQEDSPQVQCEAARALALCGHRDALSAIRTIVSGRDHPARVALIEALVLFSRDEALALARETIGAGGPASGPLARVLSLGGKEKDVTAIADLCSDPEVAPAALVALGGLGRTAAVPTLLEHLESSDPDVKLAAAAGLHDFTGAELHEPVEGEVGARRISTDSAVWREWWSENQRRFDPTTRWRRGRPWSVEVCLEDVDSEIKNSSARRRSGRELMLALGASAFEPDAMVARQERAIATWRTQVPTSR